MRFLTLVFALFLTLGFGFASGDAEARRLGGSKSSGMQRQMDTGKPVTAPSGQSTSRQQTSSQTPKKSSWMGPLAGLAAGLGLAALASHLGFGEEMASIMMMLLLLVAVFAIIGFFLNRNKRIANGQPALSGAGMEGMQYRSHDASISPASSSLGSSVRSRVIPAGFDVEGFVRTDNVNYIRLQAANDANNLDDIREFT